MIRWYGRLEFPAKLGAVIVALVAAVVVTLLSF